ncbi:hypothetical protein PMAYCL1PPCAC_17898, partial [Pristionchus mayeri]
SMFQAWLQQLREEQRRLRLFDEFLRSLGSLIRHSLRRVLNTNTSRRRCEITKPRRDCGQRLPMRSNLLLTCTPNICPVLVDYSSFRRNSMEVANDRLKTVLTSSDSSSPRSTSTR